jgi:hypothetical protein
MTDVHDDVDAQSEYDADPDLRELLTEAAESPSVQRHRPDDADRRRSA